MRAKRIPMLLAVIAGLWLAGCSVTERKTKDEKGETKNVDIRTPFGSLSVRNTADAKETGLAPYPGARPKQGGDHDGGANVNISSSLFGVKVVAVKFESDDPPEKVLSFYRKEMARYGKVVDCTGSFDLSFHPRERYDKDAEVTCKSGEGSGHEYKEELKVGTESNQRVMAVKPSGKGSEFALVYVRAHDDKDTM